MKIDKGSAKLETEAEEEKSEVILCCGYAGGDKFTVEVGLEKDKEGTVKFEVVNWRKIWYQFTHEKGVNLPEPDNSRKAYEEVFIELIGCTKKEFDKTDKNIPDRTFYKEYMIECNGSEKEVAVIGSHNKVSFRKYFNKEADKPTKCHLIICQHQWDEGAALKPVKKNISSNPSAQILMKKAIFNPYLKGKLVSSGKWRSLAPSGHADHGKKGNLTDDNIIIDKNRNNVREIKILLPKGAPNPTNLNPVEVIIKLKYVKGPYLGESGSPHMLCVYDPSDKTDFKNTVSHEIAHAFNQVPAHTKQAPGLTNHPRYYYDQGGHCNTVIDASNKQIAGTSVSGEYTTGICIMYEAKDSSCINRFCDVCKEYYKANDCSDFNKS